MFQFHSQDRGLQRVQAKIAADDAMIIFWLAPMNPKHLHNFGQLFIIRDNHSTVAESAQVLAGKEGETSHMPYRSGLPSFIIPSANRLGRIFDHMDTFAFHNLHNWIHLGALAEQMHGHDCFGPRSYFLTYRRYCRG